MAKLQRRLAVYLSGKTVQGKTTRKNFDTKNLVGVVSFFDDGTREKESLYDSQMFSSDVITSEDYKIATAKIDALLEPKSDGGLTFEETARRKKSRR